MGFSLRLLAGAHEGKACVVPRVVLHVDLDQFVVAVELRRRPELRGRPVLVGGAGDPTRRGVVAGASYEAREHGVRSGTPLRTAAARCPDAVFLPLDREAYVSASEEVLRVLAEQPGDLEPLGWDEAFLGVDFGTPEECARAVQRAVREQTGLSCSVGIGDNRLQAKTATGFGKPGGIFRITGANWNSLMGGLPCSALWGVGNRTAAALAELGVRSVGDLAAADPDVLSTAFGPRTGPRLQQVARGEDSAEVRTQPRLARSRSRETTFDVDLEEAEPVRAELLRLVGALLTDLAAEGRPVRRVVVKLRTRPFTTRTRSAAVVPPSRERAALERAALSALDALGMPAPVRLVGVRAQLG